MNIILKAARIAADCHKGQTRKWTNRPYIEHPMRVAGRVLMMPPSSFQSLWTLHEAAVAAAWLHDVIEDCGKDDTYICHLFGSHVAALVMELTDLTKDQQPDLNREQRKALQRQKMAKASPIAKLIKLIDRIDNLREMSPTMNHRNVGDMVKYFRFRELYQSESLLLLDEALTGIDAELEAELRSLCE